MLFILPLLVGLGVGALIGRWWAMVVPAFGAGAYLAWLLADTSSRKDTPWPFVIVLVAIGVVGGILLRRRRAARPESVDEPPFPPAR
jgi:hypothetical protein